MDLMINNAYQLYRIQPLQPGQKILYWLGIRKEVVCVIYARNLFFRETVEIFPASRKQEKVKSLIRYYQTNHWTVKGNFFVEIALNQVSAIAKSVILILIWNALKIITQGRQLAHIKRK